MSPTAPSAAVPVPAVTPPAPALADVEAFLCEAIGQLAPEVRRGARAGSPARAARAVLWAGLLVCVLRGFGSHLALWRLLSGQRAVALPARRRSPTRRSTTAWPATAPPRWSALFRPAQRAAGRRGWPPTPRPRLAPFATGVYAAGRDDPRPGRPPAARPARPARRGGGACCRASWPGCSTCAAAVGARRSTMPTRSRTRRSPRAAWWPDLPRGSLHPGRSGLLRLPVVRRPDRPPAYWWVSRLRGKTSYAVIHTFYQRGDTLDALVWLGAHRADRAKHAVRLVQFRQRRHCLSLRHQRPRPDRPAAGRARPPLRPPLGHRVGLQPGQDPPRRSTCCGAAKPVVVLQQVWAVLIIAQVLQALRLEIAGQAGVDPFEVSLPLLVEYLPFFAARGLDPVAVFVEQGRALRLIRPSSRTVIAAPAIPPEDARPAPARPRPAPAPRATPSATAPHARRRPRDPHHAPARGPHIATCLPGARTSPRHYVLVESMPTGSPLRVALGHMITIHEQAAGEPAPPANPALSM